MTSGDAERWNRRWAEAAHEVLQPGPPADFVAFAEEFPRSGLALELACGSGRAAIWMALRGMLVEAVDVSSVAIEASRRLAEVHEVSERCSFGVHDLDDGLPDGEPVDMLLGHRFSDRRLDEAIVKRLAPAGLLAISVLSEVGASRGRFRAAQGELLGSFGSLEQLEILDHGEADGRAWLIARRT